MAQRKSKKLHEAQAEGFIIPPPPDEECGEAITAEEIAKIMKRVKRDRPTIHSSHRR